MLAPLYILAPLCSRSTYNLTVWCTCPMPPLCARRLAPVSLAAAPIRESPKGTISMGAAGCRPAVGTKRIENGVNTIQNGFYLHPNALKSVGGWGSTPDPNSEEERLRRLPVCHAELKMVLTLFKRGFHLHPNAPKSVGGWGSAPDPPIARESAFNACHSDTPCWKWC